MRAGGWDLLDGFSNPVPADVTAAMSALGITPIRVVQHNDKEEVLARCPAHKANTGKEDRHPSFWVNCDTGAFICFSCLYSGPFVQLVVDALSTDRAAAVRWIASRGIYRLRGDDDTTTEKSGPSDVICITEASLALYVDPPTSALDKRGLTLGACREYGVLWNAQDKRWILPIRDPATSALIGWQEKGKRFFRNHPEGVQKSRTLFGLDAFDGGTAILVESPLDCVRLSSVGIPGGLAAYGAYVSDAQMRLLRRHAADVVMALDNDTAGTAAAEKLYHRWRPRGIPMRFLDYTGTGAKDPGEMTPEEVHTAVANARLAVHRTKGT